MRNKSYNVYEMIKWIWHASYTIWLWWAVVIRWWNCWQSLFDL